MQTIYQKLRQAGATASGMRLTPQDVRQLLTDTDIRARAEHDDNEAMTREIAPKAPRARRNDAEGSAPEPEAAAPQAPSAGGFRTQR